MSGPNTISLSFRVSPEKAEKLAQLAATTDRPQSWLLEQALNEFLALQASQIVQIETGLADADTGRTVPHEQVREWLKSWGDDDEADLPTLGSFVPYRPRG